MQKHKPKTNTNTKPRDYISEPIQIRITNKEIVRLKMRSGSHLESLLATIVVLASSEYVNAEPVSFNTFMGSRNELNTWTLPHEDIKSDAYKVRDFSQVTNI